MTRKSLTPAAFPLLHALGWLVAAALLLSVVPGPARARGEPSPSPPAPRATATVVFGQDTVRAEVARTPEERSRGLMYREDLPEDAGMLFIFPDNSVRGFWMQNTYLPLDIAFMDPSFRIVDIQQMEPMTTDQHLGRAPFTYALEVNQGWFEAHGVQVGDVARVSFDP